MISLVGPFPELMIVPALSFLGTSAAAAAAAAPLSNKPEKKAPNPLVLPPDAPASINAMEWRRRAGEDGSIDAVVARSLWCMLTCLLLLLLLSLSANNAIFCGAEVIVFARTIIVVVEWS